MKPIGERERLYLLLHYAVYGSSPLFREVRRRYPDLAEVRTLAEKRSLSAFDFLGDDVRARLFEAADARFMDRFAAWLERHAVDVCTLESENYPALLSEIHDPPQVLFVRGTLQKEPLLPVAMVGARKSTHYGRSIAHLFANGLAFAGCTVVSGMAAGIDSAAARGALDCAEAEHPTVAVLGTGIDVVYPKENERLFAEICERGAVVTEYLPKTPPSRENFPNRNRIMSGLSRGVVVVEAGERSGTSITAGFAHDEGREVFALPGRITDAQSVGTNRMIQRGEAKPVFCVEDILQEFAFSGSFSDSFLSGPEKVRFCTLKPAEQAVCRALFDRDMDADELAECTGLPAGDLNSCLTGLLFSGIMKQLPGRVYALDTVRKVLIDE